MAALSVSSGGPRRPPAPGLPTGTAEWLGSGPGEPVLCLAGERARSRDAPGVVAAFAGSPGFTWAPGGGRVVGAAGAAGPIRQR